MAGSSERLFSSGSSVEQLALGPRWRFWRRRRLCVAALALLGFVHLYTARVNLSVAIVHMTTPLGSRHVAAAAVAGGGHGGGAFNVSSPAGHALAAMPALLRAPLRHCHHHQHHPRTPRGRRREPHHHHCHHHHHRRRRRCHPHLRPARHGAPADAVPDVGVGVSVGGSISPEAAAVEEEVVVVDARPEFDWDSRTQGWLLAAFFYGYAASQVPAGLAAGRLGAARLFGVSVGASSVLALLSPAAVRTGGFAALLVLRVVLGLFGGLSLPAMSALWARWAPPTERARLASLAASGTNVGTVLVFFLSGALALHFGWASIFYVFGVLGLMWLAAWVALVFEGPEEDPSTPPEELLYLRTALAGAGSPPPASPKASLDAADGGGGGGGGDDTGEEENCTPWRAMACSPPLLALTAAHVAHNWGAVTFLMQLPRYLHEVHLLEVGHMGIMAAVPYVLLAASLPGAGHLSDMLVRKKLMSVTQARKAMLGGTLALQALLMLTVAHAASRGVVLGCVLAVVATGAFPRATLLVNHLDLSPRHAGLLMGVTNSLATLPGIISPVVTGFLVTGEDPQQWHAVFYIMAVLYAVGAAAFIAFGSAELQPWAVEPAR